MALLSKEKKTKTAKGTVPAVSSAGFTILSDVLRNPRITEKAAVSSESGVYVFDISPRATKRDVIRAVQQIYKVSPIKANVTSVPSKTKRNARSGKTGVKSGGRKAYVYLKKGETIIIA
jgi:large subunit ribosomal protein L23